MSPKMPVTFSASPDLSELIFLFFFTCNGNLFKFVGTKAINKIKH